MIQSEGGIKSLQLTAKSSLSKMAHSCSNLDHQHCSHLADTPRMVRSVWLKCDKKGWEKIGVAEKMYKKCVCGGADTKKHLISEGKDIQH